MGHRHRHLRRRLPCLLPPPALRQYLRATHAQPEDRRLSGCTVLLTLWTGLSESSPTPASSGSSTGGPDGGTLPTATTSPPPTPTAPAAPVAAELPPPLDTTSQASPDTQASEGRGSAGSRTSAATPEAPGGRRKCGEGGRTSAARPREEDPRTSSPNPPPAPRAGSSRWRRKTSSPAAASPTSTPWSTLPPGTSGAGQADRTVDPTDPTPPCSRPHPRLATTPHRVSVMPRKAGDPAMTSGHPDPGQAAAPGLVSQSSTSACTEPDASLLTRGRSGLSGGNLTEERLPSTEPRS